MQPDKGFLHSGGKAVIHGEVFARPINRCAETLHLVEDGAAIMRLPLPDAVNESFPPQCLARSLLARQLPLDHHLCRDTGMVRAGDPVGQLIAHPMPARQDVHLCLVEHVAHVQPAGHIRRR